MRLPGGTGGDDGDGGGGAIAGGNGGNGGGGECTTQMHGREVLHATVLVKAVLKVGLLEEEDWQ